jgi:GR25 family glycosyltransferase involved in LPS biosynthesis
MKTYLLNHPEFKIRRDIITNSLIREQINFEIVDDYSPGTFDYDSIVNNADYSIYSNLLISQIKNYSYINNPNKKSKSSISLILKHIECWKRQIDKGDDFILVIEDDCEIPDKFSELVSSIESELSKTYYDIVMIGTFLDFESLDKSDNLLKYHTNQKTRCTHAYIISKFASNKMIEGSININNAIDYKMNEIIQLNSLRVAWIEPGLRQINL